MYLKWCSRQRVGLAAVVLGFTALMASAGVATAQPAADLPDRQLVPLVAQFVKSCTKDFENDAPLGAFYCPCAAALVVDRFTVDELTKDEAMTLEAMDKAHPGIARLLKACGLAAKLSTK